MSKFGTEFNAVLNKLDILDNTMTYANKVREILKEADLKSIKVSDVSQAVCGGAFGLHRRLKAERVTYSMLLEQERRRRLNAIMAARKPYAAMIAHELGYSYDSGGERIFKRLTGKTLREYKRREGTTEGHTGQHQSTNQERKNEN